MSDLSGVFRGAAVALASLNGHTALVERAETVKQGGVTRAVYGVIGENVPCRLSVKPLGLSDKGAYAGGAVAYICFFAPDADIREGDRVTIDDGGGAVRFAVGALARMVSHTQAVLSRDTRA